jgi:hypothetical protein
LCKTQSEVSLFVELQKSGKKNYGRKEGKKVSLGHSVTDGNSRQYRGNQHFDIHWPRWWSYENQHPIHQD